MSNVRLAGDVSGTGSVTIASPNTNSTRTITLPDANGTFAVADGSGNITSTTFTGALVGNASTVTNGVYTTGNQTIGGTKTFSNGITFGDATVQTTAATAPTTATVLAATAGASAGAVGTYVLAGDNGAVTTSFGSTRAGSSLVPIGFGKPGQTNGSRPWNFGPSGSFMTAYVGDGYSPALSGTWRAMGNSKYFPSSCGTDVVYGGTLWLRIS